MPILPTTTRIIKHIFPRSFKDRKVPKMLPQLTIRNISSTVENMLIKLFAYALLAYIIYLIGRFFSAISRGRKQVAPRQEISGTMVKDETCNTYLPKDEAIREMYQGQEFFFCSEECRQKFLQTKKPH